MCEFGFVYLFRDCFQKLYDTPGVHLHHRQAAVVHADDLPALAPQNRLRGQSFPVRFLFNFYEDCRIYSDLILMLSTIFRWSQKMG